MQIHLRVSHYFGNKLELIEGTYNEFGSRFRTMVDAAEIIVAVMKKSTI